MKKIKTIHDKTFKSSMSDIRVAREFFEHHLPATIRSLIDLNTLKPSPKSYIDEQLSELSSDILFEVKIKSAFDNNNNDNDIGFLYVLAEHQSTVDPLMAFRLWYYIFLILNDYIKQKDPKPTKLPLVFPLVFYHGKEPYNGCRNLRSLIQAPQSIVDEVFFNDFCLIDTHDIRDEVLREQHWSGIMTYMMKHVYDREIWSLLQTALDMMKGIQREDGASVYIINLLNYWLIKAESAKKPVEIIEKIQQELSIPNTGGLMTLGEQLIQQGVQQGLQQGEIRMLMLQLEQKFAHIPNSYKQQIAEADSKKLSQWGIKILKAEALEEVFDS